MFGVGDYSYSPYKVGVSGFYKQPLFSVLYSDDGIPVMTDDTSYFICFDHYDTAYPLQNASLYILRLHLSSAHCDDVLYLQGDPPVPCL